MTHTLRQIQGLLKKTSVVRTADVEKLGIHRKALSTLVRDGTVERIGRGLYRANEAGATEHHNFAAAAKAVPKGVICLLSALTFHGLTTQLPHEVWIAVQSHSWIPAAKWPKMRVVQMSHGAMKLDIEEHVVEGVTVKVFSAAKTVVDCFRYRRLVGLDVALEALRDFLSRRQRNVEHLQKLASRLHIATVMRPYLEALA
ncbi:MAG: type IV toxin-antitoxin system AbiEi family antitoxin domain-containing protein [Planctomycetes bacterium]|nr:type IV toxin-antitoxin system AbiEi family antitoxin domain-containing protein [Planctomycetota bacterium]